MRFMPIKNIYKFPMAKNCSAYLSYEGLQINGYRLWYRQVSQMTYYPTYPFGSGIEEQLPILLNRIKTLVPPILSASSGFQQLSPYTQNRFTWKHNTDEFAKIIICILDCATILSSE